MVTADLKFISAKCVIFPFHLLQEYLHSPKPISVPVCVGYVLSRIKENKVVTQYFNFLKLTQIRMPLA
jgi:hypothetical protein